MEVFFRINCAVILVVVLSSCVSVSTERIVIVQKSVESISSSSETTLAASVKWTRENFVAKSISSKDPKLLSLFIETGKGYSYSYKEGEKPLYVEIGDSARFLALMNSSLSAYLKTLRILAENETISEKDVDKLTSSINSNISDVLKVIPGKPEYGEFAKNFQGFFSESAIRFLKLYMESKKMRYLREAVTANQQNIVQWAEMSEIILKATAVNLKTRYAEKFLALSEQYETTGSEKTREKIFLEILDLNDSISTHLDRLSEIEKSVALLPRAHSLLFSNDDPGVFIEIESNIKNIETLNAGTLARRTK